MHTHAALPHSAPLTAAGQLIALSHLLPRSNELAGRAKALAAHMGHFGRPPRPLALAAAELIAELLDATEDTEPLDDDWLLDQSFDD